MPTALHVAQVGQTRTSSMGEDDEERSPNGFNTSGSSFTKKLYEILDSSESCDIVCWTQDGTAFEVKEPKRLELEILPKYFRHARFQSFVRQLNFYSFKKVSKERSSWIYSHECFQRNKPDLLDRLRRKTNTSTLPPGAAVGGEKRMYEMYAAPVGLQEHDMATSLKGLRGDQTLSTADSIYYYGQGAQTSSHKQWGYDDDYVMRVSSESYSLDGQGQGAQQGHSHHGRQSAHAEYLESQVGNNRLSQHAMQSWDTVRLIDKKDRDRERERDASTTQAVSSLAFLYGATTSHTLPASSSAASALGSSSDGNRSPDSDDPSEAATDNSQSSGSLCGSKGGDRESVSTISLSSAESQHKRNCHTHHGHHAQHSLHSNSAQWQGGGYNHDPSGPLDPRKAPYQHYERDGYSSIYPAYLPQSRPHSSHQPGFRPPAPQQLGGHIQAQTQAQMMHARYLNYQQNVRQGQGREAVPKVAPIVIPATHYPSHSKSQPVIATLMDDHAHWAAKPLIVKNLSVVSTGDRGRDLCHRQPGGPECSDSMEGDRDSALSFARTKGTVMPLLMGQAHVASRAEKDREDKYIVLMPHATPLASSPGGSDGAAPGRFPVERSCGLKSKHCDDSDSESMPQYSARMASPGCALAPSSSDRSRCEAEEEEPACGNLVLDEPLGDATHALLSFCMQRNPWMYSPSSSSPPKEEGPSASSFLGSGDGMQGLGPGPSALYKDVLSCLIDTPMLREELESYSEALHPSPFPPGARGHRRRSNPSSSSALYSASAQRKSQESCRREASKRSMECDESSSDENERERETSEGDLTDDSQDSDEQLSEQARSLSYCHSMTRKRDAVEEMRAFTTFASLRMQEVCDLVCEQEQRREKRREQDRDCGLNHWALDRDGTSRDTAASAAAAAFVKALETCTQTWWAYANLYK